MKKLAAHFNGGAVYWQKGLTCRQTLNQAKGKMAVICPAYCDLEHYVKEMIALYHAYPYAKGRLYW